MAAFDSHAAEAKEQLVMRPVEVKIKGRKCYITEAEGYY